jgi:hypothetical protein
MGGRGVKEPFFWGRVGMEGGIAEEPLSMQTNRQKIRGIWSSTADSRWKSLLKASEFLFFFRLPLSSYLQPAYNRGSLPYARNCPHAKAYKHVVDHLEADQAFEQGFRDQGEAHESGDVN